MRWKRRDGVMNAGARRVRRVYLVLLLLHTLAALFVWGINTLLLLDAGRTNTQAFAANPWITRTRSASSAFLCRAPNTSGRIGLRSISVNESGYEAWQMRCLT